jgi:hypothetical protein
VTQAKEMRILSASLNPQRRFGLNPHTGFEEKFYSGFEENPQIAMAVKLMAKMKLI